MCSYSSRGICLWLLMDTRLELDHFLLWVFLSRLILLWIPLHSTFCLFVCFCMCVHVFVVVMVVALFVCFSPRKKNLPKKLPIETLFSEVVLCCLRITTYSFNPLRMVIKLFLILHRWWLLATTKLLQSVTVL